MGQSTRLAQEQQRALERLKAVPVLDDYYLAGGSAIAFHLGHRQSRDVDLFSTHRGADLDRVAADVAAADAEARVIGRSDVALKLVVCGVPVDIVNYTHAPLEPPRASPLGFRVAGLLDLGTMKLAAITRRGLRRDFWDLHQILQAGHSLVEVGAAYVRRFGANEADLYHVMRALTYFADAERDPFPEGLTATHWSAIKKFFISEAPRML